MLRISIEDKATIKAAAVQVGKSLTTFIVEAALKQVRVVQRRPPSRGIHGGLPTWFRATCYDAANGGANGYESAGFGLARACGSEIPHDLDFDEWGIQVDVLKGLLDDEDGDGAWKWFKQHYPKCMVLVPSRRWQQFIDGVRRAHEDGLIAA